MGKTLLLGAAVVALSADAASAQVFVSPGYGFVGPAYVVPPPVIVAPPVYPGPVFMAPPVYTVPAPPYGYYPAPYDYAPGSGVIESAW